MIIVVDIGGRVVAPPLEVHFKVGRLRAIVACSGSLRERSVEVTLEREV